MKSGIQWLKTTAPKTKPVLRSLKKTMSTATASADHTSDITSPWDYGIFATVKTVIWLQRVDFQKDATRLEVPVYLPDAEYELPQHRDLYEPSI